MSVSERILKRREELGLNQTDLAKRAGLKPPAISQYESGNRSPSYEALIKLSNALNVTTDFLISGSEIKFDTINDKTMKVLIRLIQNMTIDNKDKLLEYAIFLSRGYNANNIPILSVTDYADYTLKNYSNNCLPVDLSSIANSLDTLIYEDDLQDDGEGILVQGNKKVIILNNRIKNKQRKRFTLAILLGHILIPWHVKSTYVVRKNGTSTLITDDIEEIEAQNFASRLLMPQFQLEKDFVKINATIENLKNLAINKYDVSLFSLSNRLVDYAKDKYAIIQTENWKILDTFQGNRPLVDSVNPNSITATFFDNPSNVEEIRQNEVPASYWFQDAQENETIHEECIYNPVLNKVLTLLTVGNY